MWGDLAMNQTLRDRHKMVDRSTLNLRNLSIIVSVFVLAFFIGLSMSPGWNNHPERVQFVPADHGRVRKAQRPITRPPMESRQSLKYLQEEQQDLKTDLEDRQQIKEDEDDDGGRTPSTSDSKTGNPPTVNRFRQVHPDPNAVKSKADTDFEKKFLSIPGTQPPPSIEMLAGGSPKVLVTGAAGFIGYHFIDSYLRAYKDSEAEFIALDNFNGYYDPALKRMRAARLNVNHNIEVVEGDTCDRELIHNLLESEGVTHIVHLAAQPGVGYSLKHPQEYIRSNLLCEVEMLEEVKDQQEKRGTKIPFVYASSSSVYGGIKQYPFDEMQSLHRQINVYGASKVGQENIARAYHTNYDIPVLGLRFFTVYGPFGRPDMAVAKWSEKLLNGEKVILYETKDGRSVRRDFTYVHDVVNGIFGSVLLASEKNYPQKLPRMVLNVGHGEPESIKEMLNYLVRYCGLQDVNSGITLQELPKSEMETTFSNTSLLESLTGIKPKVSLRDGVYAAGIWYKEYLYPRYVIYAFAAKDDAATRQQIEQWYDFVHNRGLRMFIFHSGISESFLHDKHTGNFRFVYTRETTDKAIEIYKQHLIKLKQAVVAPFLLPEKVVMAALEELPPSSELYEASELPTLCRTEEDNNTGDFLYSPCK